MAKLPEELINIRCSPNLHKDRKLDADFTTIKLMKSSLIWPWISIDFVKVNAFKIEIKVMEKIGTWVLIVVCQGLIKVEIIIQNGAKYRKQCGIY